MAEEEASKPAIIYLKVSSLPADLDQEAGKTEKQCKVCGIPFTKKSVSQTRGHLW